MAMTYEGTLKAYIDRILSPYSYPVGDDYNIDTILEKCENMLKKLFSKINTKGLEALTKLELYFICACFYRKMNDIYTEKFYNTDEFKKDITKTSKILDILDESYANCTRSKFYYDSYDGPEDKSELIDIVKSQINNYRSLNNYIDK